MLTDFAVRMGFTPNGNEFTAGGGLSVKFTDKEAIITERLEIEDEYNKMTALTYASGELAESYLATDGKGLFFVPSDMEDMRLKVAVVHVHAPGICVLRPIRVESVPYKAGLISPEDLLKEKINAIAKEKFKSPEIKLLAQHKNLYIYAATSFDMACDDLKKESMIDMFSRAPKNEMEAVIIDELRKIYQASDLQQACSTLLHEESRPAGQPDV